MTEKYLKWRINNNKSGMISVPEVVAFAQDVIVETKDVFGK